jgi:myo-inositol catabolism protein IolH
VKLALDPRMLRGRSLRDWFAAAAETGYPYIELSPRDDFLPSYQGRRASREAVQEALNASRDTGVGIASVWTNYRWSSLDELERQGAVRYWRQAFEVAVELGCRHLNTEFKGDPFRPMESEAAFWHSIEEILPLLEELDLRLYVEPHPYDFVESGYRAVDLIRGIRSDRIGYIHCAPHTFYLGDDARQLIEYSAPVLGHVHLADTYRPSRIIVDPHDAPVRVHQHLDIGQGEIDWRTTFQTLKEIGFDDVMTVAVFAWEDRAIESFRHNRIAIDTWLAEVGWEVGVTGP